MSISADLRTIHMTSERIRTRLPHIRDLRPSALDYFLGELEIINKALDRAGRELLNLEGPTFPPKPPELEL